MSFSDNVKKMFCSHNSINKHRIFSLQVPFNLKNAYTDFPQIKEDHISKRMSSAILRKRVGASMTVEAALAIPIFIFFMANLLSLINAFNLYGVKLSKAQQSAKTQSYMCCDMNDMGADTITSLKYVAIKPIVSAIGYSSSSTLASMTYRKWTGYNVTSSSSETLEDEYVYITRTGYSYHRSRSCSHLKVTIKAISSDEVNSARNKSGSRYRPCERCGGSGTGILFITPDGDRYHSDAACSGLKRDIRTVRLSEVGGRTPCSECCR